MNFEKYIQSIVTEENILIEDSEGFEDAADYERLIDDLLELSQKELVLEELTFEEDEEMIMDLTVSGISASITIEERGSLVGEHIVRHLNEILIALNSNNRYCSFWASDCFGQESGFFFSSEEKVAKIFDYAREHNEKVDAAFNLYQINDGTMEEGFEDL